MIWDENMVFCCCLKKGAWSARKIGYRFGDLWYIQQILQLNLPGLDSRNQRTMYKPMQRHAETAIWALPTAPPCLIILTYYVCDIFNSVYTKKKNNNVDGYEQL